MAALVHGWMTAAVLLVATGDGRAAETSWLRDVAAAEAQAKAEGKPLLLVLRCER
jgi:hypothetical protein